MTLLLDIDGVLIGWERTAPENSGFDDWQKPKFPNSNWVSKTQLELVASSFKDIQWHTTWIQEHGAGYYVENFVNNTGFGPYEILIDQLDWVRDITNDVKDAWWDISPDRKYVPFNAVPEVLHYNLSEALWWKLNTVAALLEYDGLPGKVVWVDDDINAVKSHVFAVLKYYDAVDRFRLISPKEVFTRQDIEEAAAWLSA